jgi:tRNA-2-methylthio-N6-dimethylallyladenosine synthase
MPSANRRAILTLMSAAPQQEKTFYLETFGCQMNAHDSEKVVGTLVSQGYRQVPTVDEAGLVLYNTCSIRDKAEQKVFHRLADYKKLEAQGKKFGVLGCVAQQEGEKIFEKAPHVSLVCGSASYRKLPEMLLQIENAPRLTGKFDISKRLRVTGLDDRETDECFETEFTARTNPHRGYITIIEGCDKFCSYCVVPFTRGKERSRTSDSVLAEARQMADLGYTEIQLLGQNVNSYKDSAGKRSFAELLAAVGEVPGIRRVRFTTSHPRDFGKDIIDAIDAVPTLCDHVHLPVQSGSTRVLDAMQRLYTREQYLERISWMKAAGRDISITSDTIVGFPGETEEDFQLTLSLLDEVEYDAVFAFKYSPRPNTPSIKMEDAIPDEEKSRRLAALLEKQRAIQKIRNQKHLGEIVEVMVEGKNEARNQWLGRTSQNKTLNFVAPDHQSLEPGTYAPVRVTTALPNSLVGEMVKEASA